MQAWRWTTMVDSMKKRKGGACHWAREHEMCQYADIILQFAGVELDFPATYYAVFLLAVHSRFIPECNQVRCEY